MGLGQRGKAITIDDEYYLEGDYTDNTPLRAMFEDPEVEEIIAVDFTDYNYHEELDKAYQSTAFTLPLNSIDLYLLVSDIQLTLPNAAVLSEAVRINEHLKAVNQTSVEVAGKTYHYKPLHILRPKNLKSMTIALKDSTIQKKYFQLGQNEVATFFSNSQSEEAAPEPA